MSVHEDRITNAFPLGEDPPRLGIYPPVRQWPKEALKRQAVTLGPIAYARGFQQRPFSDQDLMFPSFRGCMDACSTKSLRDYKPEAKKRWETYAGVDLASEHRPGTVIFVGSVMPDGCKIPRAIRAGQWTSTEKLAQMQELEQIFSPRVWVVENNGFQQTLIDMAQTIGPKGFKNPATGKIVRLTFTKRIEPFTTGQQKADPKKGLSAMDVEFFNDGWVLPMKDRDGHVEACSCGFCRWITEVSKFPHWPTTDAVMAMWFFWDACMTHSRFCQPEDDRSRKRKSRKERKAAGRQKIGGLTDLERAFK